MQIAAWLLWMALPTAEFVFDTQPTPSCHASSIVELRNGDLLAAWFGGTQEGARDVAVFLSRRNATGWSKPVVAAREPNIAAYNPVLFHSADGVLWLYYKFGDSPRTWTASRLYSRDEGQTWSAPEHLPAGLYGPIRAKPLVLPDGVILSGTSVESYRSWAAWVERSTDNGLTWTRIGPITGPPGKIGIIQPSLIDLGHGHIRMYLRATEDTGRICQSDSYDNGLTWLPAHETALPNPNSGIDAVRLRDGRLVMVFNNTASGRTPLNLAVSTDEGNTWRITATLESAGGEYSYPAMIEAANGDLLITYTWKREKIRFVRISVSAMVSPR